MFLFSDRAKATLLIQLQTRADALEKERLKSSRRAEDIAQLQCRNLELTNEVETWRQFVENQQAQIFQSCKDWLNTYQTGSESVLRTRLISQHNTPLLLAPPDASV